MTRTKDKTGLEFGAFACGLVGCGYGIYLVQYCIGPENKPTDFRDFLGIFICGAYIFLAFAPAIMLFRVGSDGESQRRLQNIKAVEILVLFIFVIGVLSGLIV